MESHRNALLYGQVWVRMSTSLCNSCELRFPITQVSQHMNKVGTRSWLVELWTSISILKQNKKQKRKGSGYCYYDNVRKKQKLQNSILCEIQLKVGPKPLRWRTVTTLVHISIKHTWFTVTVWKIFVKVSQIANVNTMNTNCRCCQQLSLFLALLASKSSRYPVNWSLSVSDMAVVSQSQNVHGNQISFHMVPTANRTQRRHEV